MPDITLRDCVHDLTTFKCELRVTLDRGRGRIAVQTNVPREAGTSGGLTNTYEGCDRMTDRTCSFPDCGKKYMAKGLCIGHYAQQRKGQRLRPLWEGPTLSERLKAYSKVDRDCFVWTGYLGRGGYGQITWHGQRWYAHRAAYFVEHGEIPDGLQVNHICGNRACINVAHLELVNHYQNTQYLTRLTRRNTSGYRGVSFNKGEGRYKAQVVADGVSHFLGYCDSAKEAAKVAAEGRARLHSVPDFGARVASLKIPGGGNGNG